MALAAQVSSSQRALQQEQEEVLQGASDQSPVEEVVAPHSPKWWKSSPFK